MAGVRTCAGWLVINRWRLAQRRARLRNLGRALDSRSLIQAHALPFFDPNRNMSSWFWINSGLGAGNLDQVCIDPVIASRIRTARAKLSPAQSVGAIRRERRGKSSNPPFDRTLFLQRGSFGPIGLAVQPQNPDCLRNFHRSEHNPAAKTPGGCRARFSYLMRNRRN